MKKLIVIIIGVFLVCSCSFDMDEKDYKFADEEKDAGETNCEPGTKQCNGNEVWQCSANGMKLEFFEDCLEKELVCKEGMCVRDK